MTIHQALLPCVHWICWIRVAWSIISATYPRWRTSIYTRCYSARVKRIYRSTDWALFVMSVCIGSSWRIRSIYSDRRISPTIGSISSSSIRIVLLTVRRITFQNSFFTSSWTLSFGAMSTIVASLPSSIPCRNSSSFNLVSFIPLAGEIESLCSGSTVATSLSEGEQLQKHAGILHVHKKTFKMHKRPLQTVRQFYFLDILLTDHIDEKALKTLSTTKLEQRLDQLLSETVR